MAKDPINTEAEIKRDLTQGFRDNGLEVSEDLTGELAKMLKDGIRTGFEKTVAETPQIKPEP